MIYKYRAVLAVICLLLLTGCISREQADTRLANGCAAGAENFIEEGVKIKKIVKSSFSTSTELGEGYREIILDVVESDGWYETDNQYKCIFAEEFTPFNASHKASLYQIKVDDELYGKKGDEIIGSFQDHLKLTETVDRAMRE